MKTCFETKGKLFPSGAMSSWEAAHPFNQSPKFEMAEIVHKEHKKD